MTWINIFTRAWIFALIAWVGFQVYFVSHKIYNENRKTYAIAYVESTEIPEILPMASARVSQLEASSETGLVERVAVEGMPNVTLFVSSQLPEAIKAQIHVDSRRVALNMQMDATSRILRTLSSGRFLLPTALIVFGLFAIAALGGFRDRRRKVRYNF